MSDSSLPVVSIIMPAYNAEKHIAESIASAQDQTFKDWELIVIDDGSTDGTAAVVKDIQQGDSRVIYIHQENARLGAARNAGLRIAKGKFIAYLDSDDLWFSTKLQEQLAIFDSLNTIDLVFTSGYILNDESKSLEPYPIISGVYTGSEMYKRQYVNNHIPVLSVLMKSEWVKKVGFQDESLAIFGCEDWDYWIRMAKADAVFYGLDSKLFKYRIHPGSMSKKRYVMKLAEATALYKNLDLSLLDAKVIERRFKDLILRTVPDLVAAKRIDDAVVQYERLLKIKYRFHYYLAYLLVKYKILSSSKTIKFMTSPTLLFSYLSSRFKS